MCLEVGAGTAGSFDGMHCELVDTRAKKPDAVIWGHNYGIVVNKNCDRFYDEGKRHLFATFEMIALELKALALVDAGRDEDAVTLIRQIQQKDGLSQAQRRRLSELLITLGVEPEPEPSAQLAPDPTRSPEVVSPAPRR